MLGVVWILVHLYYLRRAIRRCEHARTRLSRASLVISLGRVRRMLEPCMCHAQLHTHPDRLLRGDVRADCSGGKLRDANLKQARTIPANKPQRRNSDPLESPLEDETFGTRDGGAAAAQSARSVANSGGGGGGSHPVDPAGVTCRLPGAQVADARGAVVRSPSLSKLLLTRSGLGQRATTSPANPSSPVGSTSPHSTYDSASPERRLNVRAARVHRRTRPPPPDADSSARGSPKSAPVGAAAVGLTSLAGAAVQNTVAVASGEDPSQRHLAVGGDDDQEEGTRGDADDDGDDGGGAADGGFDGDGDGGFDGGDGGFDAGGFDAGGGD